MNDIMEKSVTRHNVSTGDDLSPEEIADIKEFYSDKSDEHKMSSLEELIKELHK